MVAAIAVVSLCFTLTGVAAVGISQPAPDEQASTPPAAADIVIPDVREAVVVKTDGREVRGVLVREDSDAVVLEVEGRELVIPAAQVRSLEILPPIIERYLELSANLGPEDVAGRINLAEWLRDLRAYVPALAEADKALAIDPYNRQAADLRKWLELQISLARPGGAAEGPGSAGSARRDRREKSDAFPLLTPEEVNLMRVFEVDLSDPPPMLVSRDTVERFLASYADHELIPDTELARETIKGWSAPRVLELMFRVRAREFYEQVDVRRDPEAIKLFADRVHARWLINSCATTECHGGAEAGRLYLNNRVNQPRRRD
ncbi:MAG: hypothetical protein AAF411_31190, partial [Myxococcota bacterium]